VVTVTFRRDSRNRLSSVFADGHAGWADAGEDIVCAAVSAILQAAWVGLTDHARVEIDGERRDGRLGMRWPEAARDRADVVAIVATAELAVAQIGRQAPEHVRVRHAQEA
jgi:uncharacterized protein YsxB (DUF464 family)